MPYLLVEADMTTKPISEIESNTQLIPPWNVILLDDDEHSFDYVIAMLAAVFGFPGSKGFRHAEEIHSSGRSLLITTSREHAELKQEQCHAFGPDPFVRTCSGPMTCTIEPA